MDKTQTSVSFLKSPDGTEIIARLLNVPSRTRGHSRVCVWLKKDAFGAIFEYSNWYLDGLKLASSKEGEPLLGKLEDKGYEITGYTTSENKVRQLIAY